MYRETDPKHKGNPFARPAYAPSDNEGFDMYFTIWQSLTNQQWYWNLKSANHEIIANGEGYTSKAGCLHAVGLVMDTNRSTPVYAV